MDRTSGFVDAFARAGHAVPADDIVYTGSMRQVVVRGRPRSSNDHPTSPRSSPPTTSRGSVPTGAARRRQGVGRDVAVIGYNDVPLAAEMTVALTTVCARRCTRWRESVRMLVSILGGTEVDSERLAPELVCRAPPVTSPCEWSGRFRLSAPATLAAQQIHFG
ncbi:substrate-binding domain-containing protein [Rhodococcus hoagii]|nr:substrate-binding domain-containing protein [Prescottella equi]